jgi:hypothetical protein
MDMPREKYVERCKQRAFEYLDEGDVKKRGCLFRRQYEPPARLPHYLATLGVLLLMANDALG